MSWLYRGLGYLVHTKSRRKTKFFLGYLEGDACTEALCTAFCGTQLQETPLEYICWIEHQSSCHTKKERPNFSPQIGNIPRLETKS